jgi:hypothetical protein
MYKYLLILFILLTIPAAKTDKPLKVYLIIEHNPDRNIHKVFKYKENAIKYQQEYVSRQQILPSAPRTLTKSQIYTINEINKNKNNLTNYLAKAPTSSDILAIVPVKTSTGVPTGSLLVDFSGSLQDSARVYFGPVNIDRMAVKLLDDKGNVLNLNGNDWCFTLICECLYQY